MTVAHLSPSAQLPVEVQAVPLGRRAAQTGSLPLESQ
jgi:hypothetical protein